MISTPDYTCPGTPVSCVVPKASKLQTNKPPVNERLNRWPNAPSERVVSGCRGGEQASRLFLAPPLARIRRFPSCTNGEADTIQGNKIGPWIGARAHLLRTPDTAQWSRGRPPKVMTLFYSNTTLT